MLIGPASRSRAKTQDLSALDIDMGAAAAAVAVVAGGDMDTDKRCSPDSASAWQRLHLLLLLSYWPNLSC